MVNSTQLMKIGLWIQKSVADLRGVCRELRPSGNVRVLDLFKRFVGLSAHLMNMFYRRRAVQGMLIISAGYFLCAVVHVWLGPMLFHIPTGRSMAFKEEDYILRHNGTPLEQYVQAARQHRIFSALGAIESDQTIIAAETNMVKDLNLLGIIGDADPQAIIENKQSHKTYYVKKGSMLGDMLVENVLQKKVIIQYAGEHYEFTL